MSLGYTTLDSLFADALLTLLTPPQTTTLTDLLDAVTLSREDFDGLCRLDREGGLGEFEQNEEVKEAVLRARAGREEGKDKKGEGAKADKEAKQPDGDNDDEAFDLDNIITGLVEMFKEKNGRDPTDEEVKVSQYVLYGTETVAEDRPRF